MAKMRGGESAGQLPVKVQKLYKAVVELIEEGADAGSLKVSEITERAGIGKGTAYDYFDTREEIIANALMFYMDGAAQRLGQEVWEKENFAQRVELFMDAVDRQTKQGACLLCLVNLVFETSELGLLFRRLLEEHKRKKECLISLVGKIVEKGVADGEIKKDLPVAYMTYILMTKMVAYAVYTVHRHAAEQMGGQQCEAVPGAEISDREFRGYILRGILEEFHAGLIRDEYTA